MNALTVLPNSGPLLCAALELAKALLQTAYFSFFSVLDFYCEAVNPADVWLRSHCRTPPLAPPPNANLFFVEKEQTETENTTYQSFFFFFLHTQPARSAVKNPKASGLYRFKPARGEKAAPGHPAGRADRHGKWTRAGSQSRLFSIRALWHRVALCWEPHGPSCAMRATFRLPSQSYAPMCHQSGMG